MEDCNWKIAILPEWIKLSDQQPIDYQLVETKIDDTEGVRNTRDLMVVGGIWAHGDMTRVYYTPTHWRPKV
jgi:hypothetical protein